MPRFSPVIAARNAARPGKSRNQRRRVRHRRLIIETLEDRRVLSGISPQIELFSTSPALFVENRGQWFDDSVRFLHQGNGANVAMTDDGPVFQVFRQEADDGSLTIGLREGWDNLVDAAPYIYQVIDGQEIEVAGQYELLDSHTYTFVLTGNYDASVPLVIDPDVAWATYLGGSANEHGYGIAVDATGNALVTGATGSWDFTGAKVSPDGTLQWATLYELEPSTGAVIDATVLPHAPWGDGAASLNGYVYLEASSTNQILVFDPVINATVVTLNVAASLEGGLAGAADLGLLFGSNSAGEIFALDPATGAVVNTLHPGVGPLHGGLAYFQGELIASALHGSPTAFRIDPATGEVLGSFAVWGRGLLSGLGGDEHGGESHTVTIGSGHIVEDVNFGNRQLEPDGTLSAALVEGTLTILDTDPDGMLNQMTARIDGTDLVISDENERFIAASDGGTLSTDGKTLAIPMALITTLVIDLAGGDDMLTLDFSGGNPIPAGGLNYDGGDGQPAGCGQRDRHDGYRCGRYRGDEKHCVGTRFEHHRRRRRHHAFGQSAGAGRQRRFCGY